MFVSLMTIIEFHVGGLFTAHHIHRCILLLRHALSISMSILSCLSSAKEGMLGGMTSFSAALMSVPRATGYRSMLFQLS